MPAEWADFEHLSPTDALRRIALILRVKHAPPGTFDYRHIPRHAVKETTDVQQVRDDDHRVRGRR